MSKYSSELKSQIVSEYLAGNPTAELSNNYHISKKCINKWVQLFRMNGSQALKRRRHKRVFTQDFKLNVINYYQTHEESLAEVGAKFDLLPTQVSYWVNIFQRDGIEDLKPHQKGRPPKVNKKHNPKHIRHLAERNELDRLKEELAKKNQELHEAKLELEITKKSLALFGPSKHAPKHK